jgi:transcriptional regulator with GAF, ATPase, and Fis domain
VTFVSSVISVLRYPGPMDASSRSLQSIAAVADDAGELLRRGLDWLSNIAPYDLATVFELRGDELVVRAAQGPFADPRLADHRIHLSDFPTVRETLETRRARAFTEHDHAHGDGDPFDGVLDLPHGHSCMVVPLSAGADVYGALTLDRAVCERYPDHVVSLVEVYGRLLALALTNHELRKRIERLEARRAVHARELEERLSGPDEGVLPVLITGESGTGKERGRAQPASQLDAPGRALRARELRRDPAVSSSSPSCSATRRAPSPGPSTAPGALRARRGRVPCSSTRSATCPWPCRSSSCA